MITRPLSSQNTEKRRRIPMSRVGYGLSIPVFKRIKYGRTLDRMATGIGE
jgi:hypothetical protein